MGGQDASEAATDRNKRSPDVTDEHEWTEFLRELVDGVVEVTGVRFI